MEFKCSTCDKEYSCQRSLLNHRRRFHEVYVIDNSRRKCEDNDCYLCKYCKKEYKIPQSRWAHEKKCKIEKEKENDKVIVLTEENKKISNELSILKKENEQLKIKLSNVNTEICCECNHRKPSKSKKVVPSTVKRIVWNTYIGENIGKGKCYCCKLTDITQLSFHCGHIVSVINGGSTEIDNLKPICQNCNCSMGTKNMDEFINIYKLHQTPVE